MLHQKSLSATAAQGATAALAHSARQQQAVLYLLAPLVQLQQVLLLYPVRLLQDRPQQQQQVWRCAVLNLHTCVYVVGMLCWASGSAST
jgi:hypothetical protein